MKYITDKLEQAMFINKHGCSDLNCNTCKFITGICRIYKSSETDPQILKDVKNYLRKEKLKNIKKKMLLLHLVEKKKLMKCIMIW